MDPALLLQRQGAAATAAAAGCAPTLKKLLHLRATFETPLLHVFGFPFILRHQLSAAACCACCSSCCCCWCFPPSAAAANAATHPTISSSSTTAAVAAAAGRAEEGTAFGVYNGDSAPPPVACIDAAFTRSYASMIPCSAARLCFCCKGTNADSGHAAAQRRRSSSSSSGSSSNSSSSSSSSSTSSSSGSSSSSSRSSSGRPYEQTGDCTRAVRGNRKRLRLVGEDTHAAVVASAIRKHKHTRSTRPQDERAVEIFISGNVLRQVKLPIDAGSYVLFFTADWLQYLARYIRAAQQEAVFLVNESHCCPTCGNGAGSNNDSSLGDSNTGSSSSSSSNRSESSNSCCCYSITFAHVTDRNTSSRCGYCGQPAKTTRNNNSSGFLSSRRSLTAGYMSPRTSGSGCDECCSSRCVDDTHETTNATPLRFTPVLRQDEVHIDNECQRCCSIANDASRSRKKVLRSLPGMLAQQLKDTLQLQLLNVHTQTQMDKQVVEDVLGNYLRAWYQRRHDTVVYLRELLQRYEELLQEVNLEQTAHSEIKSQQPHQKPGSNKEKMMNAKEITHTQGPSSYAAAKRNEEGRRSRDEQSNNTVLKVVEVGHSAKVKREATQISRDAEDGRRKTTNNSDSNAEDKEPSASHMKHGRGHIGNCSNHFVKNETGSATTAYTCSMRQQQVTSENKSQAELETEDTTQSQGTQEQQRCMMNAGRCTALMKELVKFHDLLQRGCEAAAEVFSLEERVAAADVASRTDDSTLLEKPKTEVHGEEAEGADDAKTKGWNRHSVKQEKEHQGKVVIMIKEEKDEEGAVGTKNKKTMKGKEREQNCRRGSRVGVEESKQPWSSTPHTTINMASLDRKVRWAAAAVQLLTEGEKKLLCGHTPHVGLPRVAQVKKCSSYNPSVGASSGLTCATASAAPSPRVAPAAAHTSRDCGYRTNTWPQHETLLKAGRVEKGGKNHRHEGAKQQPLVNFESLLQRQVEEILLLLYEAPLLHNRAGSNAVSLAVPQQGLLVRWLRDGRKEVLSSIKRRRFKELLWVDIERRGLLKSGLGARMTLLDLKGIGGVETTETAAGEVVRAAERAEQ